MLKKIIQRLYESLIHKEVSPKERIRLNLEGLRKALDKKNPKKITRNAWKVGGDLDLEIDHPGVWDYDKIITTRSYLREASKATLNTEYFRSCHSRIDRFERHLEGIEIYKESMLKLNLEEL